MDKGQVGIGFVVIAAISVLIGLAFYTGNVIPAMGQMTKTFDSVNVTMTMPANGATSELTMCGQESRTQIITNATNVAGVVPANNYTISSSAGADGYLTAKVTTVANSAYAGRSINVSCSYEPKGYIDDGASRNMVGLIAVFMALLIAVAAIPNAREWVLDKLH